MTQQNRFSDEELLALHKGLARQLSPECLLIDRSTCQHLIAQAKGANSLREQVDVLEDALDRIEKVDCRYPGVRWCCWMSDRAKKALEKARKMRKGGEDE